MKRRHFLTKENQYLQPACNRSSRCLRLELLHSIKPSMFSGYRPRTMLRPLLKQNQKPYDNPEVCPVFPLPSHTKRFKIFPTFSSRPFKTIMSVKSNLWSDSARRKLNGNMANPNILHFLCKMSIYSSLIASEYAASYGRVHSLNHNGQVHKKQCFILFKVILCQVVAQIYNRRGKISGASSVLYDCIFTQHVN